jgi:hypothetical protein
LNNQINSVPFTQQLSKRVFSFFLSGNNYFSSSSVLLFPPNPNPRFAFRAFLINRNSHLREKIENSFDAAEEMEEGGNVLEELIIN